MERARKMINADGIKRAFEEVGCNEKQALALVRHVYELEECTNHTLKSATEAIIDAVEIMAKYK